MPDFIINNGTIVDGSGKPGFKGYLAVEGDRIKEVGRGPAPIASNGCKMIDAAGKIVCPGIIDAHSHADLTIYRKDHAKTLEPLIRQGVTTFIGGNCGMSMAPVSNTHFESMKVYIEGFTARKFAEDVEWEDTAGFMEHTEKNGLALNCGLLAPHGLIRIDAMGMEVRHCRQDELNRMSRSLELCMEAGCLGMSTGLQYMPGLQSSTRELVELGKVLKKFDGMYVSHLRTYMNELPRAVDELVTVAKKNQIRGHVSHIFWVPDLGVLAPVIQAFARGMIKLSKYWTPPVKLDADMEKQLIKLDRRRKQGVRVGADVMPTSTTFTHLLAYLPPWVLLGSKEEIGNRFQNPDTRRKIRRDIEQGKMIWPHTGRNNWSLNVLKLLGWESTIIMSVVTADNKRLEGKTLAEIGHERHKHPFDAMCDLIVEEEGRILVFSALGEPEDNFTEQSIFAALKDPEVCISTDTILLGLGMPSYLFYGAYPKFFGRYVREKKMLDMPAAVRKVSGLPAEYFQLKNRGLLNRGNFADVLVFDPKTITPNCDFTHPYGKPDGIEHVFINGRHVLDQGNLNLDPLPGKLLRRN